MLSIIIPAHNEALRIKHTLRDYASHFLAGDQGENEIIVVINGCSDNTEDIVREFSQTFNQIKIHKIAEKGKGLAVRAGMEMAEGDLLAFVDADGATSACEFEKLVANMGSNDGVIASRWLPDSVVSPKQPLKRRVASRALNLLLRVVFRMPYRDTQCGAKIFTRSAINAVIDELTIDGFAFNIDLLYQLQLKQKKITEVAISWRDKKNSTLNIFHCIPAMLGDLTRIIVQRKNTSRLRSRNAYQVS